MLVHKEILRQSVGNRAGQWNKWISESRKIPCIAPDFQMVVRNMESEISRESYILKPIFPVIRRDLDGDRGPFDIYRPGIGHHLYKKQEESRTHNHDTMESDKLREIKQGKKHMTEKGESSAADKSTPMSKPTGGATKPTVQKIVLQKHNPRIDPVTLSRALLAGEQVDDDAIAVYFDEVKKNMKPHMLAIGRYLTTQIYSVCNMFLRMR
jgi:hypothetical protein